MNDKLANILVLDIGSTYTKATAMYLGEDIQYIARTQSPTVAKNILEGVDNAKHNLIKNGVVFTPELKTFATSSAAGGLRMVALGYMPKVTAKAAKEVAMNAGAKILEVLSNNDPTDYKVEVLQEISPDMVLLAGGTDGGDSTSVLENTKAIVEYDGKATIIYAGNKDAEYQVVHELTAAGKKCVVVPNVMPTIHQLNVKPAREVIHEEFIKQIIKASGINNVQEIISNHKIIPTPGAVLLSAELIAKGTYTKKGINSVILVDLGGATTDVHSVVADNENLPNEDIGLVISNEKQLSYRTVEGNLGMRVSACGIIEAVGAPAVLEKIGLSGKEEEEKIAQYCRFLEKTPEHLPQTDEEIEFDIALASTAIEVALKRHAGFYAQEYNPVLGIMPGVPFGRDLRKVQYIIGVGGIFANSDHERCQRILTLATQNPGISLLPEHPTVLFDEKYMMYTIGVLAEIDPDKAIEFAKKYFKFPDKSKTYNDYTT